MVSKIYAFDFDGTLCREAYPSIGKPNKSMIYFIKKWIYYIDDKTLGVHPLLLSIIKR